VKAPLVKWAGGKRQLLDQLSANLPEHWDTYFEPFVGGGALMVNLQNSGRISRAVISDLNAELINLYRVVKSHPHRLIGELSSDRLRNDEDSYRQLKDEFNGQAGSRNDSARRAALFIYLNKHGYNGLWRVNRKGKFNVPFGRHTRKSLPSESSILKFHAMLRNVAVLNTDFERAVRSAKGGDFVYFDPPYHPLSKTAGFTGYNPDGFRFRDQERLARVFGKLTDNGVQLMLSNSKVPEIEELYQDFHVRTVAAKRFINCNGERRNGAYEIIVTNYDTAD